MSNPRTDPNTKCLAMLIGRISSPDERMEIGRDAFAGCVIADGALLDDIDAIGRAQMADQVGKRMN